MPVLRWPGATARYSHFRVPVETGTPPRRRKVRLAPFPPDGENCARSLAPPLQTGPATLGSGLGRRLRRRIREILCKVHSAPFPAWQRKLRPLPCSSSPNRTRCAGLRFGTAASPPYLGKSYRFCADSGQTEAGSAPAPCRSGVRLLGLVTPSPARGSPRRRCPQ